MTYNGTPILEVKHPALSSRTAVRYNAFYQEVDAAEYWGIDIDVFWMLPRDKRAILIAKQQIAGRIAALQAWEERQRMEARARSTRKAAKAKP